ncbi:FdhD [Desulfamplus magnetovallimortis]|uniref:Sulfur carrier protein FdhD n=1 Tax=Desulfamplus magnetovallimortis TaxID=1246637 RepID=A0A1W1HH72_9BACT|nr:formate dehydrogenase accessory sulfurtransferase FdhD [Desulfamplus magnetovallimortis]SLM31824.1 FdhD [Desulfamplus magnetovallimortis]
MIKNNSLIEHQLKKRSVLFCHLSKNSEASLIEQQLELVIEEPLSINVQGQTYSVIMRTPGEEKEHAAGFCLSEGLVDHPDDIVDIALCDGENSNVVAVMLTKERAEKISDLLNRKGFVSQTSCGICGREIIDDLNLILTSVPERIFLSFRQVIDIVERMDDLQNLKKRSLASHAALVFDRNLNIISYAEDAGRHNALDKAIGGLFLNHELKRCAVALISSRASYEMIQKCARAGIEIVISMSIPTTLACELGQRLGMTLAAVRKNKMFIFTGQSRIV